MENSIVKEEKENSSGMDWNKIFNNPVTEVYEGLIKETENACQRVFQKYVVNGNETTNDLIENNVETITSLTNEINVEKKTKKITSKKAANVFILFFCIFIVGLFFIKFFIDNFKVVNKFYSFRKERVNIINSKIQQNRELIPTIFNKFSILGWKNKILEELDINKIRHINSTDFSHLIEKDGFYSYDAIQKYQVRNSYFYDILYTKEYWKNVITRESILATIQTKDGPVTKFISASHVEPTPFMFQKHAFVLPTNYRPDLKILENDNYLSKREYDRAIRSGKFLLENPELYQYYNFSFNDKIGFLDYFKVKTQENFVKFAKSLKWRYKFYKLGRSIFVSNNYDQSKLPYSDSNDWFEKVQLVNLSMSITLTQVFGAMCKIIKEAIFPIFKCLAQAYLNTNIASEVYEEKGRYLSNYYYDSNKKNINLASNLNIMDILTKTISSKNYWFNSAIPSKDIGLEIDSYITDNKKNLTNAFITFKMFSYWKEDLIDSVWTNNHIIDVPYEKFHPLIERKQLIYLGKYRDSIKKDLCVKYSFYNKEKSSYINLILDENTDADTLNKVQNINDIFNYICDAKLIESDFKMQFDNDGLFIFINSELSMYSIENILEYFSINIKTRD
ncbi:hypothetical protein [Metamycoplasma auris]|uniref:Uncharacterized protein n=1 Tax=Metamycoplasma auris TaxID=51363 RepID=A0A2W7GCV3_9BACT|nr:hypothetical protein [Metamycoplasma auris]PZW01528.1 hypothetical protein BCF89_10148 [Metamycoplasma auris]